MVNSTALEVVWDEPFTWEQFPILHYTMMVHNSSNQAAKEYEVDSGNTSISENTSQLLVLEAEAEICSELMFEVKAFNEIGSSSAGTTSGSFPVGEFNIKPQALINLVVTSSFAKSGWPVTRLVY